MARTVSAEQRAAIREAARDELAVLSFKSFVKRAWPLVDPSRKLVWNWHYDLLCDELEAVVRGECRELVICVPPGTGKSMLVSALLPAWVWLQRPAERILCTSANPRPITRDAIRMRNLVNHHWYRERVEAQARRGVGLVPNRKTGKLEPWGMAADQNEKVNFENGANGGRVCATILGAITGDRYEGVIVDDPYDAKQALLGSPVQIADRMGEVITIYDDVLEGRLDPLTGWRITIMQRLHEGDLAGELIRRGVRNVVLPMAFEANHPNRNPRDPRRVEGELLFPARFTQALCDKIQSRPTGPRTWLTQHQQRPTPDVGMLFLREWLAQRYNGEPARVARNLHEQAITVDCAFKDTKGSDYVVMQAWGRDGTRKYLLDQVRARMDFPATLHALKDFARKWPQARLKLVEAKANGDAVIAMLRSSVPGLIGYDPKASKYARAQTASLAFEAGEVWLPSSDHCPWIGDYVEEFAAFPGVSNDDQVDATSQLFIRWDGPEGKDALERTRAQWGGISGGG